MVSPGPPSLISLFPFLVLYRSGIYIYTYIYTNVYIASYRCTHTPYPHTLFLDPPSSLSETTYLHSHSFWCVAPCDPTESRLLSDRAVCLNRYYLSSSYKRVVGLRCRCSFHFCTNHVQCTIGTNRSTHFRSD